jgi:Outer membrane protein beta-barrel domain
LKLKMTKAGCLSFAVCTLVAVPASAQMAWTDRAFANVNFGLQEQSRTLESSSTFSLYGEDGSLTTSQPIDGGALFDLGGGYKVWKNLAVGLGYSRMVSDGDIAISASVPDPNFFDHPRPLTGVSSGAEHSEHAIHLQGTWVMPVTDKIDVGFSFGPTIFMVGQDVATAISVTEPAPTLSSTTLIREDHTSVGINLGVDVNYFVRPNIGAGILVRYAYGSVDLDSVGESLAVGGFQLGFGLRYRFK